MKRLSSFLFLVMFVSLEVRAGDVEIEGICYSLDSKTQTAWVVGKSGGYQGDIIIPSLVTYESMNYSVIKIQKEAFRYNKDLTSITFPKSIETVGSNAFGECSNLKAVYINDLASWCNIFFEGSVYGWTNPLSQAHHLFLNGEEIKDLVIPNGVTVIKQWAFVGCSELTSITIPSTVNEICDLAFYKCDKISRINIEDLGAWCNITFNRGNVFGIQSNPLATAGHLYLNGTELTDLELPNGITEIKRFTFAGCKGLKSVIIPSGVTCVGMNAFSGCNNITTLSLPSSLEKINEGAFSGCKVLRNLNLPEGLTYIGNSAFGGCSSLSSIEIPNNVTEIGEGAFSGCSSLASIVVPNSVTAIGEGAFNGCDGLFNATLSENIQCISRYLFSGCYNLKSISIPDGVIYIGERAFNECSALTALIIPDNVKVIYESAFRDCDKLKTIKMSDNIEKIGNYAFYNCNKVTSISFPNTLNSIGNFAFAYCSSLSSMIISSVESIGEYAFYGCSSLSLFDLPNTVTVIGEVAFGYCTSLTKLSIPSSLKAIPMGLLSRCTNIKEVYCYNENVPKTDKNAFINSNVGNATLYVLEGSIEKYQSREPWNYFKEIKPLNSSGLKTVYNEIHGDKWYDLKGHKLASEPSGNGLFIHNGKTILKK